MKSKWSCSTILDIYQKIKIQIIFIDWAVTVPEIKIYY